MLKLLALIAVIALNAVQAQAVFPEDLEFVLAHPEVKAMLQREGRQIQTIETLPSNRMAGSFNMQLVVGFGAGKKFSVEGNWMRKRLQITELE